MTVRNAICLTHYSPKKTSGTDGRIRRIFPFRLFTENDKACGTEWHPGPCFILRTATFKNYCWCDQGGHKAKQEGNQIKWTCDEEMVPGCIYTMAAVNFYALCKAVTTTLVGIRACAFDI